MVDGEIDFREIARQALGPTTTEFQKLQTNLQEVHKAHLDLMGFHAELMKRVDTLEDKAFRMELLHQKELAKLEQEHPELGGPGRPATVGEW